MNLWQKHRWIFLWMFSLVALGGMAFSEEQFEFDPVKINESAGEHTVLLKVVVNSERAFFVEARYIRGRLALPVVAILKELRIPYQIEDGKLTCKALGTGKTVALKFKDNMLIVADQSRQVIGDYGESDYYLNIDEWSILIGTQPGWSPENQELQINADLPEQTLLDEQDTHSEIERGENRSFQPINRLDLYLTGFGNGWAFGSSPGLDYFDVNLEWRTHGLLWGGRLTLGGAFEWEIEPNQDWSFPFNEYRWERDFTVGRLTIGTQVLEFWDTYPTVWEMRGVSLTNIDFLNRYNNDTIITGYTEQGDNAEIWLNDRLLSSTAINNGMYSFSDISLPSLYASPLVIVIKKGDEVIERKNVLYIPGEKILSKGERQYIAGIGEAKDEDNYEYWASGLEWVQGFTDDLTLGGHIVATDLDDQTQLGFNIAWRPKKNFILKAESWFESSANAWKLSTDWGKEHIFIRGSSFHRDLGFAPIFPSDEQASSFDLSQLAFYWNTDHGWQGIIAGEYSSEKTGSQNDEIVRFETSLDYQKGDWQGTAHYISKNEKENPGETSEENRLLLMLLWDFKPNQWLESGFEYSKTTYNLSEDDDKQEGWLRWTHHGFPRDRWIVEYRYLDDDAFVEHHIQTRWNHLWTTEWNTYTGLTYGWGDEGSGFDRYTWACGLEYRMTQGLTLSIGYEYSIKQYDSGVDEYRQGIWLQASMGLLFGSGKPSIVPYGGDSQTTGVVTGIVYQDLNNNGMRDKGEPGVNAIRVVLDGISSTVTDADGRYVFFNVSTGIHRLSIDETLLPVNYNPIEHRRSIYVLAGASLKEDLGLLVVGAVSGRVFIDHNGNGSFDEGETLLAGVRVQTESGDAWATTGKGGDYYIQLMAGEHKLVIDASTLPENVKAGAAKTVRVGENGEEITGLDFAVEEGETKK